MSGRYAGRSVLVTGAEGFIGSWLAERLLEEGARVVVPRRDVEPAGRFRVDGIEERCVVVLADIRDYDSLVRILNEYEVDSVFHLAAQTLVATAHRSPLSTFESNVRGTYTLLEACRVRGVVGEPLERIVVASSDKAYGQQDSLPYREELPLLPAHPYEVSKAAADLTARSYAKAYGLPVAVTRFGNVYGGGDLNWSRIVPDTARALALGERPVIRSDGSPRRDYLYVEDAVSAYLAVADSLERPEHHGRAWNASGGEALPVLELVHRLIAISGRDLEPDVRGAGTPAGEIRHQELDSSALREELGWAPEYDLDRGLSEAWSWYERHVSGER